MKKAGLSKPAKKPLMVHKEVERYRFMHSMDCYWYEIRCSCGKKLGGWTTDEAEKDFMAHLKKYKSEIKCDFCGDACDGKIVLRDALIVKKDRSDIIICNDCLTHYSNGDYDKIKLKKDMKIVGVRKGA